jgi:hypothetical protein
MMENLKAKFKKFIDENTYVSDSDYNELIYFIDEIDIMEFFTSQNIINWLDSPFVNEYDKKIVINHLRKKVL